MGETLPLTVGGPVNLQSKTFLSFAHPFPLSPDSDCLPFCSSWNPGMWKLQTRLSLVSDGEVGVHTKAVQNSLNSTRTCKNIFCCFSCRKEERGVWQQIDWWRDSFLPSYCNATVNPLPSKKKKINPVVLTFPYFTYPQLFLSLLCPSLLHHHPVCLGVSFKSVTFDVKWREPESLQSLTHKNTCAWRTGCGRKGQAYSPRA